MNAPQTNAQAAMQPAIHVTDLGNGKMRARNIAYSARAMYSESALRKLVRDNSASAGSAA